MTCSPSVLDHTIHMSGWPGSPASGVLPPVGLACSVCLLPMCALNDITLRGN